MPKDDLFDDDQLIVDPNKNYLEELVGEGKKFATPEDLARAKAYSDAHIAQIEDEQKRLRDDLATRIKYEEFLDKLTSTPLLSKQDPQDLGEQSQVNSATTPEELERLLDKTLTRREADNVAKQNVTAVVSKLKEAYGPNYAQHLKRQTSELDMSEQLVHNLASTNPRALFKLLGIDEKPRADNLFSSPPRTEVSSNSMSSSSRKGESYFEEIRKTKPLMYWTPKVQNEYFARLEEMGREKFYSS